MPASGWLTVTVPGAPRAWRDLHDRWGKLPFESLFEDAMHYAQEGYALSPVLARGWRRAVAISRMRDEPQYAGWLPNYQAPEIFARYRATVHVPRRPYVEALPGIPTIRPFEALACGIPLISAPWNDCESLFSPGEDFLVARDGEEMKRQLRRVLNEPQLAQSLAQHGLQTIRARHTCAHRVDELLGIYKEL
jgi:spore maturation protein CgeB